jgi:phage terminase large subunit
LTTALSPSFPEKVQPLFTPNRYKILHGGRGGAKSWSVARVLAMFAVQQPLRVLCAREFQKSIAESVHKLLSDQIVELGLSAYFGVQNNSIYGHNGSEFIFDGIRTNPNRIKSLEGIDIAWVEEAEKVSERSWELLIPTIRKPSKSLALIYKLLKSYAGAEEFVDPEIWVVFNPDEEKDATSRRFFFNPPPDAVKIEINWQDNPWFPETLRKEKDYLYSVDVDAAEHVWNGKFRRQSDAQIFKNKYIVESFVPETTWHGPYYGADWGFSVDPSVLMKMWIDPVKHRLMVEEESYGVGVELNELPQLFDKIKDARKYTIRADNSRPETISHVRGLGFKIIPAEKWSGSVEDGIAYLRSFDKIVFHPQCKRAIDEAHDYRYKTDPVTFDVLPIIVDKHNHCWDAIRYAMQPHIRQITEGVVSIAVQMPQISPELDQAEFRISQW